MDFNEEYGNIMIMSDCEENLNSGFSNLYGKMKDGVIAFADKNSILTYLPLYQGGKFFNTNANGNAVLVLPGATYGDYNAEISYSGLFNNASTGTYEAVCSVSLGSDVESAKVAMVKAANDDEAVKAVTDGTVESVEIRNSGDDQQLFLPVDGDGTYYATVVTYAKGSVQKSATTRVKITVASTEEGNWEDFGSAMIIDGWATGRFTFQNGYTYEDVIWEIPVQRNTENHNMLRLVDMYTSDPEYNFLVYSGTNINTAGSYVVIDITNPAAVGIAPQWGGMTWAKDDVPFAGGDDLIIGNQVGYAMSLDYTNDEAIDLVDGNVDALEDGILTITQPMFEGPEGFGYSWTSKPYSALQFSALTPAGAPAKVGAKTRLSVRRIIANGSRKAVRASSEGNRYRISLRATTTNATLK